MLIAVCWMLAEMGDNVVLFATQYTAVPKQSGAPLRTVTVRDAIGDLPPLTNGADVEDMDYAGAHLSLTPLKQPFCTTAVMLFMCQAGVIKTLNLAIEKVPRKCLRMRRRLHLFLCYIDGLQPLAKSVNAAKQACI